MHGRVCGAKTRTGKPCPTAAMENGRCRMHGGKSPVGIGHPCTKHGRHSRHLPTRLASLYREAQADPDLTSVRDELNLVDAMVNEALSRLDTKEAEAHWAQLGGLVEQVDHPDPGKRHEAKEALKAWSAEALSDFAVKAEVLDLVERRRKLCETESKRLAVMGQMISSERMMVLVGALVEIVRRNVTDRNQLSAISRDIAGLLDDRREAAGLRAFPTA